MARPKRQPQQVDIEDAIEHVRMKVTSENHAFEPDGTKHWKDSTPTVPMAIAEDWMKHNRAEPL